MAEGKFVTAINCMDGRVQLPVIEYMKNKFNADYVDMITEAGPIKCLADNSDPNMIEDFRFRTEVSVAKHGSKVVAIVGHAGCAGNPVDRDIQIEQIKKSIELAKSWGFDAEFLGLYVNENWEVEEI
ncbi:MAG: hypothetical protein GY865_08935 [candidate division Zixibacteria bacterium]|nr:hypothetical protein [candidate division Zixibacteria bacterium]